MRIFQLVLRLYFGVECSLRIADYLDIPLFSNQWGITIVWNICQALFNALFEIFHSTSSGTLSLLRSSLSLLFHGVTSSFFGIVHILKILCVVIVIVIILAIVYGCVVSYLEAKEQERRKAESQSFSNALAFLGGVIAAGAAVSYANHQMQKRRYN